MTGIIKGTRMAVDRLPNMVNMVSEPVLPPSFPVTTMAAVAVGQIKQIIAASTSMRHSASGIRASSPPKAMNVPPCIHNSFHCHGTNFSSFGFILQNERKSMLKISMG